MPQAMEWPAIATGLFFFGWSCIAIYVAKTLNEMKDSVQALNVNVAVVIERVGGHETRIQRLEDSFE